MSLQTRPERPSLEVGGTVGKPAVHDREALAALPGAIPDVAAHAAGFSGRAIPVAAILSLAEPRAEATHCTVVSGDGLYTASIPLDDITDSGWLIYGEEDGPLPRDRGGPLRVVVPQGRTLCWNVKDVITLRLTAGNEPDSVPANPPH